LAGLIGCRRSSGRNRLQRLGQNARAVFGGGKGPSVNISDQRRELLLPHEVKEIGTDQAISFYERLRPILSHTIRYFEDRRFKARLARPPALSPIEVAATSHGEADTVAAENEAVHHRPKKARDVPARPLTEDELQGAVDRLLGNLLYGRLPDRK